MQHFPICFTDKLFSGEQFGGRFLAEPKCALISVLGAVGICQHRNQVSLCGVDKCIHLGSAAPCVLVSSL